MSKWILIAAALLGALAVVSGAFGAHALTDVLSPRARGWYDTAVTYQMNHALALLACGVLARQNDQGACRRWLLRASLCFIVGILFFSGSLYAMAFTGMTRLGMITPIGGVFFIVAWLSLAFAATRPAPHTGVQ